MPTATANKEYNTFVKGIITEANPLSFPENASVDENNFILHRNGSRQRRYGMDYETDYTLVDTTFDSLTFDQASVNTYRWDNVANDPTLSFGVVFIYDSFWFMDLNTDNPSANLLNSGIPYRVIIGPVLISTNDIVSFTDLNGDLYIAIGKTSALRLRYDPITGIFSYNLISIEIRDLFGVQDNLDIDKRPTALSDTHKYNLLNQGWDTAKINTVGYPSNADIWTLAKDSNEDFDSALLFKQHFGTTLAPRGKHIFSPFRRGLFRQAKTGLPSLPSDLDNGGISTITSAFGRLFYSGILSDREDYDDNSPNLSTYIFFSKIVSKESDVTICYQEADPTSEHISDIIDTDGGFINIPEVNNIISLEVLGNSVLVFAENGIWDISGGETNFTATSYSVSKISDVGVTSKQSIVKTEDSLIYWAKSGIYVLTISEIGDLGTTNLTENTIQTLYTDIPSLGKAYVAGHYDAISRKISWLYNDTAEYDGASFRNKYNKELILDTTLGAFYPHTIQDLNTDSPYIAGYLSTPSFSISDNIHAVIINGEQIQVNGEDVIITERVRSPGTAATKYLVIKPTTGANYKFTLGWYHNTSWKDWYSVDSVGKDAPAYLLTGLDSLGDTMRNKVAPYILFHFKRTEDGFEEVGGELEATNPSSCMVQARWDYSDHINSGKWGIAFQAYRLKRDYIPINVNDAFDYGRSIITTKNRLRGSGKTLSLYIYTEEDKDCYLHGWGINFKGRTRI